MSSTLDLKIGSGNGLSQRKASKAKTRRAIMQAAEELFAEQGFLETRVEEIASKAEVAVGTIYLHFGDKQGLLREVLLQAADELHRRVLDVYENPPESPLDLAKAHVEALVRYIEEHERLAVFALNLMLSGQPTAQPMLDRMVKQVERGIRRGQDLGVYRKDIDARLAARAEAQMNLGLLAWWAEDPKRASREDIIETLAKFRLSGLHARKPA